MSRSNEIRRPIITLVSEAMVIHTQNISKAKKLEERNKTFIEISALGNPIILRPEFKVTKVNGSRGKFSIGDAGDTKIG